MSNIIIKNIKTLYTFDEDYRLGTDMTDVITIDNAYVVIENGFIKEVGSGSKELKGYEIVDASSKIMVPGFVDSHTHLVHGGSRELEFMDKINGVDYLEILRNGGGILSTVKMTNEISEDELYKQSLKSLQRLVSYGVTTLEIKSGYGLCLETELKQLRVIKRLKDETNIDVKITYLGAHALPIEYQDNRELFIDQLLKDMEIIKELNYVDYVDVFCEEGAFTKEETDIICVKAKQLGFDVRLHVDEVHSIGGVDVGIKHNAHSLDHLMAIKEHDIINLGNYRIVANLLPLTSFYLNKEYAKARMMIEDDLILSISSDYNPGSAPSENYLLAGQLAVNKMKLNANEALCAMTLNGAYSLRLHKHLGSIEVGKQADLLLVDSNNIEYMFYHFGVNLISDVIKKGKFIYKNKQLQKEFYK